MSDEELGVLIIVLGIVFIIIGILLYFLPAIIAYKKSHANKGIILLLNFLLGWTFLGWAACLVWAFIDTDGKQANKTLRNVGGNTYEDLLRLQKLKESGAINEIEFEIEKAKLLK